MFIAKVHTFLKGDIFVKLLYLGLSSQQTISELPGSKRVNMGNHSFETQFSQQVHFHANQTHFHKKSFARRLVLKRRHKEALACTYPNDAPK